jgi:hypothetical protein
MRYMKPEIVALGKAAAAIQSGDKQEPEVLDNIQSLPNQSQAAYEADE